MDLAYMAQLLAEEPLNLLIMAKQIPLSADWMSFSPLAGCTSCQRAICYSNTKIVLFLN